MEIRTLPILKLQFQLCDEQILLFNKNVEENEYINN